ncbi:hypothetical protein [Streptomyces griseiscabiei]|uniref:Uncharacterized protein n=1 Tax=Streptomyces griseiscabiei TaxID=2993540 RepID=A0ABU4LKM3_9ACTN|nr:hypothetical protein [Streptomyces griseiscabiei]MBZ3908530.1 hypothetical protein [Streptomyces griseiscabiei]MDX2916376.1 hypothetical protein [Streptomyces griseiscabiei]
MELDTWNLDDLGGASVFSVNGGGGLVKPLIFAADRPVGEGATDFSAFIESLSNFLNPVPSDFTRGHDPVLVGYFDDASTVDHQARVVREAILKVIEKRKGDSRLTVGGIGQGAQAVRLALVWLEDAKVDHQTQTYFSYNGTPPATSLDEEILERAGWPKLPRKLKLVTEDFTSELKDDDFDETIVGTPNPEWNQGGMLFNRQLVSAFMDKLK